MNSFFQFVNRLGMPRIAAMVVVAALMLGFFAFLIIRASTPTLAPLYTGLAFEDSSAIVRELEGQGVPFELRGDGETILIPRDQITRVRMALAETGLPNSGQVGYEIFDQQNALGATSFVQNINNVRALEGELARTISSLARIKSARVHLVLPERELFRRDRKEPSASIVLAVRGELSTGEIRAIQHLVASAIEGLAPTRVSIVDGAGRLLASGSGDEESVIAGQTEERTLGVENRLRGRIEDLLINVLGAGRARVEVSAELDLNRSTRTSETFDPEGQVVRSTQTRELANQATGPGNNGEVTVANELPGATENAATAGTSEQQSTTEETTNFEISKTVETAVTEAGAIRKLSVAVVVDGVYAEDGAGGFAYTPRSDAEIAQITTLVRSAIGFDEARGDRVEVVNMQFAEGPDAAAPGTEAPGMFDFTRDDLMNAAQMGVTLIIALALLVFVMRPLLRRVLTPEVQPLALAASAEVAPGSPAALANGSVAGGHDLVNVNQNGGADPSPLNSPGWMANARHMGESQLQTLKTVGELVGDNPSQAALIVRDWLKSAA